MRALVIGEKTSQIKRFSSVLCKSVSSTKHSKYVYQYNGSWLDANKQRYDFTFLPLAGHITTIDTAKGFGWGECPPIKIVYEPRAIEIKNKRGYVTILRKLIKQVDELWLALDPDAEGDNIALEVVNILERDIKKKSITIRRIWNSSLIDAEIRRSFEAPRVWNDLLAHGVQGRRMVDAWMGFAGTREITRAARQVVRVKVFSVGRVQLPTLYFIVYRDIQHEVFVSQDRWKLIANLITKDTPLSAEHEQGYFLKENRVDEILTKLQKYSGDARITDIKEKLNRRKPPEPLNTTAAVALLTRIMGISAKKALDLMVDLYNKGLLSYPRTENKKFKDKFPHKDILSKLLGHPPFVPLISSIKQNHQVVVNGRKKEAIEDHDPIHPTGDLGISALNKQQLRAWDILSRFYISHFMHDLETSVVRVDIAIDTEKFKAEGITVVSEGWKGAHNWSSTKTKLLPPLVVGDRLQIMGYKKSKHPTKPPNRLTDSSILKAMENANIGTKSSRPDILKKLVDRNYIVRNKRTLISTDWGRALIASLSPIWPRVVTPAYTADVELKMDEVSKGVVSYDQMLRELRDEYIQLHGDLLQNLAQYKKILAGLNMQSQKQRSAGINKNLVLLLSKQLLRLETPEFDDESVD